MYVMPDKAWMIAHMWITHKYGTGTPSDGYASCFVCYVSTVCTHKYVLRHLSTHTYETLRTCTCTSTRSSRIVCYTFLRTISSGGTGLSLKGMMAGQMPINHTKHLDKQRKKAVTTRT